MCVCHHSITSRCDLCCKLKGWFRVNIQRHSLLVLSGGDMSNSSGPRGHSASFQPGGRRDGRTNLVLIFSFHKITSVCTPGSLVSCSAQRRARVQMQRALLPGLFTGEPVLLPGYPSSLTGCSVTIVLGNFSLG